MNEFKHREWQPTPLPLEKPFGEPMPEKPKAKADEEKRGSIVVNGIDDREDDKLWNNLKGPDEM